MKMFDARASSRTFAGALRGLAQVEDQLDLADSLLKLVSNLRGGAPCVGEFVDSAGAGV